jgi:hypothetical protein
MRLSYIHLFRHQDGAFYNEGLIDATETEAIHRLVTFLDGKYRLRQPYVHTLECDPGSMTWRAIDMTAEAQAIVNAKNAQRQGIRLVSINQETPTP